MTVRYALTWYWSLLVSFIAGFVSTLAFHQGLIWAVLKAGVSPGMAITPYNMEPVDPLGVPAVVSLAFWGGVWGIALWAMIKSLRPATQSIAAVIIGALGPTALALLVIFPHRGIAVSDEMWIAGGVLNAVWAVGTLSLVRVFMMLRPVRETPFETNGPDDQQR
ncbi:MAG: hypothetical protein Alpg2KO_30250 [Alphaproteobacteria bacterium]